jgi:exonuclease III
VLKKSSKNTLITENSKKFKDYLRCLSNLTGTKELLDLIRSTVITSDKDHKNQNEMLNHFTPERIIFYISTKTILSLTIYLTLLKQNVESNPGEYKVLPDLSLVTFNCNGLGDKNKLKKLLRKLDNLVEKGSIIFLQETHIVNTDFLKIMWKHNFISNCVKTNSAGVIILFSNQYKVVETYKDMNGRNIVAAIQNDEVKLIVSNSYFSNDHGIGIKFTEDLYTKILEFQHKFVDHVTVSAGDFNTCLTIGDSLNRQRTHKEEILSEAIRNNNKITKLVDGYRSVHNTEGYTWKRGKIYSRLDYIFISDVLSNRILNASLDWGFGKSDHAAVIMNLKMVESIEKGPGITQVNTKILEDPTIEKQVGEEIKEMLQQSIEGWNPHERLEFLKVAIRTIISSKVSKIRNEIREQIKEKEESTNQMEKLRLRAIKNENNSINQSDRINACDLAINDINKQLDKLRSDLENKLTFISKAKWFEYGERSNKFFLNLNKCKQIRKCISEIWSNGIKYTGQQKITECIRDFYSSLYKKVTTIRTEDQTEFYKNCPKLSSELSTKLENALTLEELRLAVFSCKESSPGSDGIPYSIYKRYWSFMGPIILESWNYSLETDDLPPSHKESIITLLPKEGKDTRDIKNWRPITLSNCDAKLITKAIANRLSKVLDTIIHPSQTAYIPGRSVADNLRSNFFYKKHCKDNKIKSALISLDAKKAFDSVDHKYIEETLIAYGFGKDFVNTFKLLYKDLTARILVNGHMSENIKIERGVKQGDALSCAIFIICVDPLLRNINENKKIAMIKLKSTKSIARSLIFKSAAFADDVSVICESSQESIQNVFDEYERLTNRSGLELNADKTEILIIDSSDKHNVNFRYLGKAFQIESVSRIKICGLNYCTEQAEEYSLNVKEKIVKMSYKMKLWMHRNLTMEGKVLISKTFGLSQLVYNMQCYDFKIEDLVNAERILFGFLWSTSGKDGKDRIKRSILKNNYLEGGLNVTDIDCLNRALKLRQFVRANESKHEIHKIQMMLNEKGRNKIEFEYNNETAEEAICSSAQNTINNITDFNRVNYGNIPNNEYGDPITKMAIEEVASINLMTYLRRKNKLFHVCMLKKLNQIGIYSLGELIRAYEVEIDNNLSKAMKMIISVFPVEMIQLAEQFSEDVNSELEDQKMIRIDEKLCKPIKAVTTKELQQLLKTVLRKVESANFCNKLNIANFDKVGIIRMRQNCRNPKLRSIFFRLMHGDFFTHVKMKKYKMVNSDNCPRCGITETMAHLVFECNHAKKMWCLYNDLMRDLNSSEDKIQSFENVFNIPTKPETTLIKLRLIQCMIQIERPMNWDREKLKNLVKEMIQVEKYNSTLSRSLHKFESKWLKIIRVTVPNENEV